MAREYTIELPKGIEGDMNFAAFCDFCTHFGCDLQGATRSKSWIIETDDVINFFWLGANMTLTSSSNLTTTPREMAMRKAKLSPKR